MWSCSVTHYRPVQLNGLYEERERKKNPRFPEMKWSPLPRLPSPSRTYFPSMQLIPIQQVWLHYVCLKSWKNPANFSPTRRYLARLEWPLQALLMHPSEAGQPSCKGWSKEKKGERGVVAILASSALAGDSDKNIEKKNPTIIRHFLHPCLGVNVSVCQAAARTHTWQGGEREAALWGDSSRRPPPSHPVIGAMLMTSAVISDFSCNLYSAVAWAITGVALGVLRQQAPPDCRSPVPRRAPFWFE